MDNTTPSRKREHVEIVVDKEVTFRARTTGLEEYVFVHNALPEIDLDEVDTSAPFLGRSSSLPFIVSSMTGGYAEAEGINGALAEACEELGMAMGVGSQRQAMEDTRFHSSFQVARRVAPSIPLFGNIGAAELTQPHAMESVRRLADLIEADGFAVHLNPLQELLQPEGSPRFAGVLGAIENLVRHLEIPVIVKEVGAGLSANTVQRLVDVGVTHIDVAGAGGTSWAGVEILRRSDRLIDEETMWDWGIPTARAVADARPICEAAGATLIASGGIATATDAAIAIALGGHFVGVARPVLTSLMSHGTSGVIQMMNGWGEHLRRVMFLTGSRTIAELRCAPLRLKRSGIVPGP